MNKLESYQIYANKCAEKLAIPHPILRWAGGTCKCTASFEAHCHVTDGEFPRGTICLNMRAMAYNGIKGVRHTLAHEVVHLSVKSTHDTPTFDRRMVTLGVANKRESRNARSQRNHRHEWGSGCQSDGNGYTYFKYCRICKKREE